jgi:hypothetical protein
VSNLMTGRAEGPQGNAGRVKLGEFELLAERGDRDALGTVKLVIRPERVELEDHGATGPNRVPGMVERVLYVGSTLQVLVHLAHGETMQAWVQNRGGDPPWQQGSPVMVHLPPEALRMLKDTTPLPSPDEEIEPAPAS